jgi:hypothetical protein
MTPPAPARILYSGSRTWPQHWAFIVTGSVRGWAERLAARELWPVFVHGACPQGVDSYVDAACESEGLEVERHPADWSTGRSAGIQRNAKMIKSAPLVTVVLRLDDSPGASYTLDAARRAELHWELYDATTTPTDPAHAVIMYSTSRAPTPVPLASLPTADPLADLPRFPGQVTGVINAPGVTVITETREVGRCVHDLIRDQCAHCRPRAERMPGPGSAIPAVPARSSGSGHASRLFTAGYDGACAECFDGIDAGDPIAMLNGSAVCESCGRAAGAQ